MAEEEERALDDALVLFLPAAAVIDLTLTLMDTKMNHIEASDVISAQSKDV